MKRFAVWLILTAALPLAAKVYWPGTGRGGASGSPRRSFAEESGARHQMTEPVIFNGVSAEVHVYRLPRNLTQFLEELHRRYPELVIRKNAGGMLLHWPGAKNWRERVLLVAVPGSDVITAFAIRLPEKMPPMPPWPAEMPPISGAELQEVMVFPERHSVVVNFSGAANREIALQQGNTWLLSRGFVPVTGEALSPGGSGEIYRNSKTGELFLFTVSADGHGTMMRSRTK